MGSRRGKRGRGSGRESGAEPNSNQHRRPEPTLGDKRGSDLESTPTRIHEFVVDRVSVTRRGGSTAGPAGRVSHATTALSPRRGPRARRRGAPRVGGSPRRDRAPRAAPGRRGTRGRGRSRRGRG